MGSAIHCLRRVSRSREEATWCLPMREAAAQIATPS